MSCISNFNSLTKKAAVNFGTILSLPWRVVRRKYFLKCKNLYFRVHITVNSIHDLSLQLIFYFPFFTMFFFTVWQWSKSHKWLRGTNNKYMYLRPNLNHQCTLSQPSVYVLKNIKYLHCSLGVCSIWSEMPRKSARFPFRYGPKSPCRSEFNCPAMTTSHRFLV